jgi:SAM-dependent methyltransferase
MSKPTLLDLYLAHHGKVAQKWEAYFGVYERAFAALREAPVSLLEIGVQNGGSLELWGKYFASARLILGCDIDQRVAALIFEDPRIDVVAADVNSEFAYNDIVSLSPQFDIIIDDGSHHSRDVVATFERYFPLLAPGGVYVIEDLHTSYWPKYGGGVEEQRSSVAFLKLLADLIHREFWREQDNAAARAFFPSGAPGYLGDGTLESVEFANSMAVLRRAARPHGLGKPVIAGDEALIAPDMLEVRAAQAAGTPVAPR